jgi:hypothetical protein
MPANRSEETNVGQLAIRLVLEGKASGGSVAVFEFDVPAGAKVPIAHSHDVYEETIYGLTGVLTWTLNGRQHDVGCPHPAGRRGVSTTMLEIGCLAPYGTDSPTPLTGRPALASEVPFLSVALQSVGQYPSGHYDVPCSPAPCWRRYQLPKMPPITSRRVAMGRLVGP